MMITSPLPHDLAHPRRDRASFIANLVTGGSLLLVLAFVATLLAFTRL